MFSFLANCPARVHPILVPQDDPFSSLYLIAFFALLDALSG
jgi:hypothetical protein